MSDLKSRLAAKLAESKQRPTSPAGALGRKLGREMAQDIAKVLQGRSPETMETLAQDLEGLEADDAMVERLVRRRHLTRVALDFLREDMDCLTPVATNDHITRLANDEIDDIANGMILLHRGIEQHLKAFAAIRGAREQGAAKVGDTVEVLLENMDPAARDAAKRAIDAGEEKGRSLLARARAIEAGQG